jgi:predicted ATP-dependent Lon-type protease
MCSSLANASWHLWEQLKKIGGMEFFDVHFSYIDQESMEEKFISVREQGGASLMIVSRVVV